MVWFNKFAAEDLAVVVPSAQPGRHTRQTRQLTEAVPVTLTKDRAGARDKNVTYITFDFDLMYHLVNTSRAILAI
jgi:hypothetical protein